MRHLEDMLTDAELKAVKSVFESVSPRFDKLALAGGLDPKIDFRYSDLRALDFRGADLRNFDFTGSDLRDCVINENTIFDVTTVLQDAKIDWIEADALPIVTKMREIEVTSNSEVRLRLLSDLSAEFGRTKHVVDYLILAAIRAKSIEEFLDFADFIPASVLDRQAADLRSAAARLLNRKFSMNRSRTRRDKTNIFAVEVVVSKLKSSSNSLSESIYGHLADIVGKKTRSRILGGIADIEPIDVERAFELIGR